MRNYVVCNKNCATLFFQQQVWGKLVGLISASSPVRFAMQQWKNYQNLPTFAKVIVKTNMAKFFIAHSVYAKLPTCWYIINIPHRIQKHDLDDTANNMSKSLLQPAISNQSKDEITTAETCHCQPCPAAQKHFCAIIAMLQHIFSSY